jgi:hypothetical protein
MTATVLTPQRRSTVVELGNGRWRKQLLPIGSVTFKGRKLQFTQQYLSDLAKSFADKAFDMVPFQLADGKNSHTNDPERTRGKVVGVEMANDGLDVIIETDDDGGKLLEKYPELGVSARIYENYERSDGKGWRAALQHVLGTLDPHVTGMRPWSAITLSQQEAGGRVIDLSAIEFESGEEDRMAKTDTAKLKEVLAKLRKDGDTELTDEESDQLLAIVNEVSEGEDTDEADLSDEELDRLIAEAEGDDPEEEDEEDDDSDDEEEGEFEDDTQPTESPRHKQKIAARNRGRRSQLELTRAQLESQGEELLDIRTRLAEQSYKAEQRQFAQVYGIPPYITELARPLLEGDGTVVELSNGDQADSQDVMRQVLTAIGKQIKILDLGNVIGNGLPEPDEEAEERTTRTRENDDFVKGVLGSYTF